MAENVEPNLIFAVCWKGQEYLLLVVWVVKKRLINLALPNLSFSVFHMPQYLVGKRFRGIAFRSLFGL